MEYASKSTNNFGRSDAAHREVKTKNGPGLPVMVWTNKSILLTMPMRQELTTFCEPGQVPKRLCMTSIIVCNTENGKNTRYFYLIMNILSFKINYFIKSDMLRGNLTIFIYCFIKTLYSFNGRDKMSPNKSNLKPV